MSSPRNSRPKESRRPAFPPTSPTAPRWPQPWTAPRDGSAESACCTSPAREGTTQALRGTGALDVTVDNLRPQIEGICYSAITATRAVLPAMLTAGTGTLLYTTGASSVTPAPVFVSAGMAGAALRKWVLTLNGALALPRGRVSLTPENWIWLCLV